MKRSVDDMMGDEMHSDPGPSHSRMPAWAAGAYYGSVHKPKSPHELLIQFRCEQEINKGAYRLNLPHACHLEPATIKNLDEIGRCFGCTVCQRFHDCERDRHTCPTYEIDDTTLCWFSKKPRENIEMIFEEPADVPTRMNKARASLKEIHIPTSSDVHGKAKLLRSANALTYDRNAHKKLLNMATNHGKNMHGLIVINEYNQQMKRTQPKPITQIKKPADATAIAYEALLLDALFRECVYNRGEYKRDSEFYLDYYEPIWSEAVAGAAARLHAKCAPSRHIHTGPVKCAGALPGTPDTAMLQGLYAPHVLPQLPVFRLDEFQAMVGIMIMDLMPPSARLVHNMTLERPQILYYAERVYMLVGLFHSTCLHVWKWNEIVQYAMVCIMGLFRRNTVVGGVMLWVADSWLNRLDMPVGQIAFQRTYMQNVWKKIAHKFENHVGHFIKNIRDSVIPPSVIRTILHSQPSAEQDATGRVPFVGR